MASGPGRSHRKGISLAELFRMFPDDAAAERWLVEQRWQGEIICPRCQSTRIQTGAAHPTMPMRCRDCRRRFSVRTGTPMEASNLGYQVWVIAIYMMTTSIKGVSSMRLHRDLNISQKSAWHLAHRLRETWREDDELPFAGPVEADETLVGGKAKSMHGKRRKKLSEAGWPNKVTVAGIRDRKTGKVRARVVEKGTGGDKTIQQFLARNMKPGAPLYTDEGSAYRGQKRLHEAVSHGAGEYVRGEVGINGMESFWSLLKRGYVGTFHRMSPEHVHRYLAEFVGRHNVRDLDTIDQMAGMVRGWEGKRLRYPDLIAHRHGRRARAV